MTLRRERIKELKRALEERCAALAAEVREDVARSRDESFGALAGQVTDSADEASADLLSDVDQAEVTRDLTELREMEAALARIRDGSYGRCLDCGADIELERLHANPAALRCIDCQRVHEKTYAHPGEPRL